MARGLILLTAAFWPVWAWYARRMSDGGDDRFGLLSLATAVALAFLTRDHASRSTSIPAMAAFSTLTYAVSYLWLPPLGRAIIAVAAFGFALSVWCFRSRLHLAFVGLLMLSLPAMTTLQFYAGYPMRAGVTEASAALARFTGFAVSAEGTCLAWAGRSIAVDAPCSGVRMLWVGLYLAFTLACAWRLTSRQTVASVAVAVVVVLAGNVLRSVALFYVEARIVTAPAWAHGAVGIAVFALCAAAIVAIAMRMRRKEKRGCFAPAPA